MRHFAQSHCHQALVAACLLLLAAVSHAACVDSVLLVPDSGGQADDWNNTYQQLLDNGYHTQQIFRPQWGSNKSADNDHRGSEETPIFQAIEHALAQSCSHRIDIIAHGMGVTLAAQQIINSDRAEQVDSFVAIAGAYRGLWSCGSHPWNATEQHCGSYGLAIGSPFLDWLHGQKIAQRVYSLKSWSDQIVCATGVCSVGGVHSSQIKNENASFDYDYDHFALQTRTANKQIELIR